MLDHFQKSKYILDLEIQSSNQNFHSDQDFISYTYVYENKKKVAISSWIFL